MPRDIRVVLDAATKVLRKVASWLEWESRSKRGNKVSPLGTHNPTEVESNGGGGTSGGHECFHAVWGQSPMVEPEVSGGSRELEWMTVAAVWWWKRKYFVAFRRQVDVERRLLCCCLRYARLR